jgi:hypothetical protein
MTSTSWWIKKSVRIKNCADFNKLERDEFRFARIKNVTRLRS